MTTLHSYILRELLKVFLLATGALTALFTMGGGLFNILKLEGVTASDMAPQAPLLMIVACGITMPVAALFATTMVYGRLAADNEFTACRAAGINVLRLFLSAMLLAIFVALFTFMSTDIVVPALGRQMVDLATGNLHRFAEKRLRENGYVRVNLSETSEVLLTVDEVQDISDDALRSKGFPVGRGIEYMLVLRPTFVSYSSDGALQRATAAEQALCEFDNREPPLKISATLVNVRDVNQGTSEVQLANQRIGPIELQIQSALPPIAVSISGLAEWQARPWEGERFPDEIAEFRQKLRKALFLEWATTRLAESGRVELPAPNGGSAILHVTAVAPGDRGPTVTGARLEIRDAQGVLRSLYTAPGAEIRVAGSSRDNRLMPIKDERPDAPVVVLLNGTRTEPAVRQTLREDGTSAIREDDRYEAVDFGYPADVLATESAITDARLIDELDTFPVVELQKDAERLQRRAHKLRRKAVGQIHTRLCYAASSLVTIPLAAALGLIFRGSRALGAFGLACVPFGSVMLVVLAGKQMTDSAGSHAIGPWVIWGGLAAGALATLIVLLRGVRR